MAAIDQSLAGLQFASRSFESAARRIVAGGAARIEAAGSLGSPAGSGAAQEVGPAGSSPLLSDDLVGAMIDLLSAEHAFKANAATAGRIAGMHKAYLDSLGSRGPNKA